MFVIVSFFKVFQYASREGLLCCNQACFFCFSQTCPFSNGFSSNILANKQVDLLGKTLDEAGDGVMVPLA